MMSNPFLPYIASMPLWVNISILAAIMIGIPVAVMMQEKREERREKRREKREERREKRVAVNNRHQRVAEG
jgi:MFS superfamily sulfate permease-like transporter